MKSFKWGCDIPQGHFCVYYFISLHAWFVRIERFWGGEQFCLALFSFMGGAYMVFIE